MWYSYLAVHPVTKAAGYAGITDQLTTMMLPKIKSTRPIRAWLQVLAVTGLAPEIVIVGKFATKSEAAAHETKLVAGNPDMLNKRPLWISAARPYPVTLRKLARHF
jgi:hypothetical protein